MSKDSVENYRTAKQLIGGVLVLVILLSGWAVVMENRIEELRAEMLERDIYVLEGAANINNKTLDFMCELHGFSTLNLPDWHTDTLPAIDTGKVF